MMKTRTQVKRLIDISLNGLAIASAVLLVSMTLKLAMDLPAIVAPPRVEAQGLKTPPAIKSVGNGAADQNAPASPTATLISPTATPVPPTPLPPTVTPLPPTPLPATASPTATSLPPTPAVNADQTLDIHEERWIDVDLSEQRLTAYKSGAPVRSFLVSTGLPATPTPVGHFRIWIKLRYDDMAGPGYYLEDVPFVMYFHEGYGLHGVTWHANFGHRMSHGCVNLPTAEAAWLFDFAEVGTLVNVHE